MSEFKKDRKNAEAAIRNSGIVVVMNASHIKKPEHMITTMKAIYDAGYIAEVTCRIDMDLLAEAMIELVKIRAEQPADKPFVLGVGSVINPAELDATIEMGFDMIVAPADVMGGYGSGADFVRIAHEADVFCCPAVFTPTELNYFLERDDGMEPDGIKIFPARTHGPKGVADLLAPYVRERHKGKLIMPTGAVNFETGPEYRKAISSRGFAPILGMSAPLQIVVDRDKPGDPDTVLESLKSFADQMPK